jgi:hypothetical protein
MLFGRFRTLTLRLTFLGENYVFPAILTYRRQLQKGPFHSVPRSVSRVLSAHIYSKYAKANYHTSNNMACRVMESVPESSTPPLYNACKGLIPKVYASNHKLVKLNLLVLSTEIYRYAWDYLGLLSDDYKDLILGDMPIEAIMYRICYYYMIIDLERS